MPCGPAIKGTIEPESGIPEEIPTDSVVAQLSGHLEGLTITSSCRAHFLFP